MSAANRYLPAAAGLVMALVSVACGDKGGPASQVVQAPPPETVYVRQPPPPPAPPPPLEVAPRILAFDAIGDTARLKVPEGTQCAAATDAVARVDDQWLVTAAGNGDTHLRCWLGERNATVKVHVKQALARVAVVAQEGLAMRRSGDSLRLSLARVDRRGTPVEDVQPGWRSLAPGILRVDEYSGVVTSLADTGTARVVGYAGALADTVIVEIGAKSQASTLLSSSGSRSSARSRAAARANQRAQQQRAALQAGENIVTQAAGSTPGEAQNPQGIGARSPTAADSLFMDPTSGAGQHGGFINPYFSAGFGEHRLDNQGLGGNGLGKTSGALFGGGVDIFTRGMLSFRMSFLTGKLSTDTATARDRKVTQGSFDAGLAISPSLTVLAGVQARRYETLSIDRWLMVRAGGEATFNLGGGPLRGIVRIFVLPLISLASDLSTATSPSFGLQSNVGVGFENNRVVSSLTYDIERYSFPSTARQKEQFGALMFRFGYKFGW